MKINAEKFVKFIINLTVSFTNGLIATVLAEKSLPIAIGGTVVWLVYSFLRLEDKLDDLRSR